MDANIVIAAGFPHELLGLLRRMPGIDDLNLLQDSERFIVRFEESYSDKTEYINIMNIACKLGVIAEMSSIIDEPMWRKRSFINKSIIQLMSDKRMKEYQACEILESFMQIFGWEFEVSVARRWKVTEEESTDYYKGSNIKDDSESYNRSEKVKTKDVAQEKIETEQEKKAEADEEVLPDNAVSGTSVGTGRVASKETTYKNSVSDTPIKSEKIKTEAIDYKRDISDFLAASSNVRSNETSEKKDKKYHHEGIQRYADDDNIYDRDEYIKNEILKGGIKFENLMTSVVRRDVARAIKGNSEAQYRMGKFYSEPNTKHTDYEEALKWYRVSASQGNKKAQFELGMLYDGGKVKCIDYKKQAFKCYLGLAESGFPTAQCMLGMKYKFGDGVEEDINEAIKWFKKAAAQGHTDAQRNLGDTYMAIGKKEDAMKWYGRAASAGDVYSEKMLVKK